MHPQETKEHYVLSQMYLALGIDTRFRSATPTTLSTPSYACPRLSKIVQPQVAEA